MRPSNEQIKQRILDIFGKTERCVGWPRTGQKPVSVGTCRDGTLEIEILDLEDMSFAQLERVAEAVGSKQINFRADSWSGGSDLTPCNGTDITLYVKYETPT